MCALTVEESYYFKLLKSAKNSRSWDPMGWKFDLGAKGLIGEDFLAQVMSVVTNITHYNVYMSMVFC